ncbi:MAG: tetratricopeptide repeat protein [Candidatus Coatesbacteria bacterium]|nr:MAG: tetratricopeptide repeat protein [Candidatus Coatesbacteria bacterium]
MITPAENESDTARLRAATHFARGRQLFNANRFEEALQALEEAISEDPTFTRAQTAKANTLTMLGRTEEAVALCDEVIARLPTFGLAYTAKASALHRSGRAADALENYRRGAELEPDNDLVHYNFACYWALEGNEEECERELRRALELDASAKSKAATDEDFASVRDREWFQELVALGP